jgi:putative DNA primase/helicase
VYTTVFRPEEQPAPVSKALSGGGHATNTGPLRELIDEQIVDKARRSRSGGKFTDLWNGNWQPHFRSQSEADSSVVFTLAFYTKDSAQIDRLFRTCSLMRPKWDERHGGRTYGQMTIDKALAEVKGQWRPRQVKSAVRSHDASAAAENEGDPDPRYVVDHPEPMRVAEHYLHARRRTSDGTLTLRRYRHEWWAFEHCGYRALSEEVALADLYRHLDLLWTTKRDPRTRIATGGYERLVARTSIVNEVARAIPACGAIVEGEMPQWLDGQGRDGSRANPADVVAFRNGLLDTASYCRGDQGLIPLTPSWFAGVACPYDFDPTAACPNWLAFLNAVFDGDEQSVSLLQEWYGVNLIPDNRYERLMLFVGPPRAGKGTALEVLAAMLGEGQVASTSFAKLASRFGLAPLVGRLAAILPDAHVGSGTDAKAALEVLKSISGNDAQAVDRKGIDELPRVRLFCRFSIAVNELPKLPDEAGALRTRLLLLHFRNSFAGREDTTLKARLRAEAPGIAVWALQGLRRLRTTGTFTVPARSASMVSEFEKIVSPVLGFVDDCCELCPQDPQGVWVDKDALFDAWRRWCHDRGSTAGSKADFGQALLNTNKGIAAGRRGPRGQQFTVYTGVRPCQ